jgi:hypothetical protein
MRRAGTLILLATLTAMLLWAGQALGGRAGPACALAIAAVIARELARIKPRDTPLPEAAQKLV